MRVIVTALVAIGVAVHAGPAWATPRWAADASVTVSPEREQQPAPAAAEPEPDLEAPDLELPDPEMPVLDQWAFGATDTSGISAGAGATLVDDGNGHEGGSPGGSGGGPAREIDCLVTELDPASEGLGSVTPGLRNYDVEQAAALVEGHRYYQECWYVDTGDLFYADVWDQGPPAQPGVNPRVLAQSALSRVPFTVPVPGMAPAIDAEQITGLPTWLWLDPSNWAPVEADAAAAGVSVTVTATPVRVEWDMGDGTVVQCDGPGVVWDVDGPNPTDTDCSHVFQHTSVDESDGRYSGSVSIVWSIAWQASTGEGGTLPEGRSSAPFSLLVTEMQAVATYHP